MAASTPEDRAVRRTRAVWERQAASWDATSAHERRVLGDVREQLIAHATGRVLDVGIGTGRNLPFYPRSVTEVAGIDISPAMLSRAHRNAVRLELPVDLRTSEARSLPFRDEVFDTVVCTLALCEIPDQVAAVDEMRRVLRPGGALLLLDHIEYSRPALRWLEWLRARWRGVAVRRRPLDLVREAGFEVESHESHLAGFVDSVVARRPAGAATVEG